MQNRLMLYGPVFLYMKNIKYFFSHICSRKMFVGEIRKRNIMNCTIYVTEFKINAKYYITRRRVSTHPKVCGFTAVNYIKMPFQELKVSSLIGFLFIRNCIYSLKFM